MPTRFFIGCLVSEFLNTVQHHSYFLVSFIYIEDSLIIFSLSLSLSHSHSPWFPPFLVRLSISFDARTPRFSLFRFTLQLAPTLRSDIFFLLSPFLSSYLFLPCFPRKANKTRWNAWLLKLYRAFSHILLFITHSSMFLLQ